MILASIELDFIISCEAFWKVFNLKKVLLDFIFIIVCRYLPYEVGAGCPWRFLSHYVARYMTAKFRCNKIFYLLGIKTKIGDHLWPRGSKIGLKNPKIV